MTAELSPLPFEPFPYQVTGALHLLERPASCLADEMGLGKTIQAILALRRITRTDPTHTPPVTRVVCPAAVRSVWRYETERWFPELLEAQHLEVLSYEALVNSQQHLDPVDVLIVDEAQYVKNPLSQRARAVAKAAQLTTRAWFLTGTPMPNGRPTELWPMMALCGATDLEFDDFSERYLDQRILARGGPEKMTTNPQRIKELKSLIQSFILRRKKADVAEDLPPISYHMLATEPHDVDINWSRDLYCKYGDNAYLKKVLDEQTQRVKEVLDTEGFDALAADAKSISTLRMYLGLQKIASIGRLINEELKLGLYEKIFVVAHHRDVIECLKRLLIHWGPQTLYGGTNPNKIPTIIRRFQRPINRKNRKNCHILIGQTTTAGTGITLTAASHVLVLESPWDPGALEQIVARCHRIGTKDPVIVRMAVIPDSLDEVVYQVLMRKMRDLEKLDLGETLAR